MGGAPRTLATVEAEKAAAAQRDAHELAQQQAEMVSGVFNANEDAIWRGEMSQIPEHAPRAVAASTTNATALGADFSGAATTLSKEGGIDPAEAERIVSIAYDLQERIVARAVAKVGVQADQLGAFYDHIRSDPHACWDISSPMSDSRTHLAGITGQRSATSRRLTPDSNGTSRRLRRGGDADWPKCSH